MFKSLPLTIFRGERKRNVVFVFICFLRLPKKKKTKTIQITIKCLPQDNSGNNSKQHTVFNSRAGKNEDSTHHVPHHRSTGSH